jgi:hypothetical protein
MGREFFSPYLIARYSRKELGEAAVGGVGVSCSAVVAATIASDARIAYGPVDLARVRGASAAGRAAVAGLAIAVIEAGTSSESVMLPRKTLSICSRLKSAVKTLRPSEPRRCVSIETISFENHIYRSQSVSSNWGTQQRDPDHLAPVNAGRRLRAFFRQSG